MQTHDAQLREQFNSLLGHHPFATGPVRLIRAPGRVNLIGEHTDYNDGFVCPMAIEPDVRIACRARTDGVVRLASTAFAGEFAQFSLAGPLQAGDPDWGNYSLGVAAELLHAGIPLLGMDALLHNTLPVGGGLSSSAAVEVGTGRALLALAGHQMDGERLARLCQRAEHNFAGVPVGIMDQMIVATAKQGSAMLLDCRSLARQYVCIEPAELRVVIVNSGVKHALTGGEYKKRRDECEEGVAYFVRQDPAIRALRDVSIEQVSAAQGHLPDVVFRRCRHVVTENARTTEAAKMLAQRRYEEAGRLMAQSHASLRDDYQVSIPELDFLAEQSMKVKGVYGARMTGGGFGGCIVALAQPRAVDALIAHLTGVYAAAYGKTPAIYITTATAAAGEFT